jgi:Flp pilus assembly pilin Flp
MVEYALMLALIALACVGAITLLGTQLNGFYTAFVARMP